MDPDANLREQREISAAIIAINDAADDQGNLTPEQQADINDHADRLAELVQALDEWITKGGFLPRAYARTHHAPSEPRRVSDAARRTARKVQP